MGRESLVLGCQKYRDCLISQLSKVPVIDSGTARYLHDSFHHSRLVKVQSTIRSARVNRLEAITRM